jgi:hypothetical protein
MRINGNSYFAHIAAVTSVGSTGWAWIEPVGAFLQIVATVVAIVAGLYAIRQYRKKDGDSSSKD